MVKEGKRICDVCGDHIPKATKYRNTTMHAEAARLLSALDNPGLVPSWTVNDNGTVTMDICLECTVSIGATAPKGSPH